MDARRGISRALVALGGAAFLAGLAHFSWVLITDPPCTGYLCGIGLLVTGLAIAAAGAGLMGIGLAVAPAGTTPLWLLVIVTLLCGLPLLPGIVLLKDAYLTGPPSFAMGLAFTGAGLVGIVAVVRDWRSVVRRLRHA